MVCPDCGQECDGVRGLGVHRSRMHRRTYLLDDQYDWPFMPWEALDVVERGFDHPCWVRRRYLEARSA